LLCCCLKLASTEEYIDGAFAGNLGEVLIRCNNVMYLRGVPEDEASGKDDAMKD
jgi:small nuclear ribonucleoprotein F